MGDFYKKHNLSATHFAQLLGMDIKTLRKYERNEKLRDNTVGKIELGKKVVIENNLIFPEIRYFDDCFGRSLYRRELWKVDDTFEELYKKEL